MLPRLFSAIPERAVFGHRGTPLKAPENTMPSFHGAVELGVHGLEFDVRLTSDGEVVVFHDADLVRMTGQAGTVAETPWSQLRELDAALAAFPSTPMLSEIKVLEAAAAVKRILLEADARDRCMVGAFQHETLLAFDGSGIARSASTREVLRLYLPALLGRRFSELPYAALSVPPVHRGIPVPLRALARAAGPARAPVFAWTINSVEEARSCWRRGVRAVLSDDPETILAAR